MRHFSDDLCISVGKRLGLEPRAWFGKRDLSPDADFDKEIHDQLDAAILILVTSPTYIRSDYCCKERRVSQNHHHQALGEVPQGGSR
jgi:hypothetical protein